MDLSRHCALCDHQLVDLKKGTTCRLTDRKPEFNKTCSKIELNDKFEQKIKQIHFELENVKRTKADTFGHVILFSTISIAAIFGGFYLGIYAWDAGLISTVPLIIIGLGFFILPVAIGPLNKYRNGLSMAKVKKSRLDEVLNVYRITYDIDLEYGKEIHGTPQVKADLKIKGRR